MIQVKRLFVKRNSKILLHDINFRVREGLILGVYGPNGSGKSTLLRSITAHQEEYEVTGEIVINQTPQEHFVSVEDRVKTILYLGSDFRAPFDLRVRDLFEMSAMVGNRKLWSVLNRHDHERISKVVHELDLSSLLNRNFRTLSDGEKQWVMLARGLIQGSRIIVFDESFSKLDLDRLLQVGKILRLAAEKGLTLIVCSHDLNFLSEISDEILLLKDGKTVMHGPVAEVFNERVFQNLYQDLNLHFYNSKTSGRPKVIY